jgi:hypothetical protein
MIAPDETTSSSAPMLDVALAVALVWGAYLLIAANLRRRAQARHVWGEFDSAQIARMRRRPDRR